MAGATPVAACIGLGANLGDPARQIEQALTALAALPHTRLHGCSRRYRSPAIGPAGQPDYCNAVALLHTALAPEALLHALQGIETAAGRVRGERWGARVLDLDLLLHGDTACTTAHLTLPHPEMHRRRFVLAPLAELAADLPPSQQDSLTRWLAQCPATPLSLWT